MSSKAMLAYLCALLRPSQPSPPSTDPLSRHPSPHLSGARLIPDPHPWRLSISTSDLISGSLSRPILSIHGLLPDPRTCHRWAKYPGHKNLLPASMADDPNALSRLPGAAKNYVAKVGSPKHDLDPSPQLPPSPQHRPWPPPSLTIALSAPPLTACPGARGPWASLRRRGE